MLADQSRLGYDRRAPEVHQVQCGGCVLCRTKCGNRFDYDMSAVAAAVEVATAPGEEDPVDGSVLGRRIVSFDLFGSGSPNRR